MKITPLIIFKYTNNHSLQTPTNNYRQEYSTSQRNLPAVSYRPFINFGANKDFDTKLNSLNGVHCPCCGTKTINKEIAANLVRRVNNARTAKELAKIFHSAEQYFRPEYKLVAANIILESDKNPDISPKEVCKKLSEKTGSMLMSEFKVQAQYLEDLLKEEKFSSSDREKINEIIEYLDSTKAIPRWRDVKEKLVGAFSGLETPEKWKYFYTLRDGILAKYNYSFVLKASEKLDKNMTPQGCVMERCLSESISKIEKYDKSQPDDIRGNKLLVCSHCFDNLANFKKMRVSPKLEEMARTYIEDIKTAIVTNKLEGDNSYILDAINLMNKIGKGRVNINPKEIKGPARAKIFAELKSEYIFENYEGIPCATCGVEMLTHNQKIKIYKEIEECENLHELMNTVSLYKKNISPKCYPLFERFCEILNNNPDIEDEEMLKYLSKMSGRDIAIDLVTQQMKLQDYVKSNDFNYFDKMLIKDCIKQLDNIAARCLANEPFIYDEYDDIISQTLDKMVNKNKKEVIKIVKQNIKSLYVNDLLSRPKDNIVEKAGNNSKAMFENIFKQSGITVDHTLASKLGGKDIYENKLGYCKGCNQEKSGIHFASWSSIHPEINQNLPKQLIKISEIIKEDGLQEFKDYPSTAARNAMRLSCGKLNIPENYD